MFVSVEGLQIDYQLLITDHQTSVASELLFIS